MSDLISRQALKNALTDWQMEYAEKDKDTERFETLGQVLDLVEQIQTIDAVEVVRCKDCKWWERDAIFADGWCRGKRQGNPEWFCADGERSEE